MEKRRHTESEIEQAVKELESGVEADSVARSHEISKATRYNCRKTSDDKDVEAAIRQAARHGNGFWKTYERLRKSGKPKKHKKAYRLYYTQPGCPTQNSYVGRVNGSYRQGVLGAHTLAEALDHTSAWQRDYSVSRPHESIGNMTPGENKDCMPGGKVFIGMKRLLTALVAFLLLVKAFGQPTASSPSFDDNFTDQTLRLDYIFAGDVRSQVIFLDQLNVSPRWYGKRHRLSEVPVQGNGQLTIRDAASGELIYMNSFSTLFQEWQDTPEAKSVRRSFENVFLAPMPKRPANVTVTLRNPRHQVVAELTHRVDPADILIRHIHRTPGIPTQTILQAKDTTRCIHLAFVAEGFTREEMPHFLEKAREATEAIFSYSPFKESRDLFNVVAVMPASAESGPSIPRNGLWKQTALGSHFDTFYSERYLTTLHQKALHDALAGTPYEHIIVLVNTRNYGGGGILNAYNLTMTDHHLFSEIVVHEFGHSFAGLADEYAYDDEPLGLYPLDVEPWEKNITTKVNFESKWANLVGQKGLKGETIGLYEGAGYKLKGVYRPTPSCRMRDNTYPEFCPICQAALKEVIDFYTAY